MVHITSTKYKIIYLCNNVFMTGNNSVVLSRSNRCYECNGQVCAMCVITLAAMLDFVYFIDKILIVIILHVICKPVLTTCSSRGRSRSWRPHPLPGASVCLTCTRAG